MKITIIIECEENLQDVKTHLSVVRQQILSRLKNDSLNPTGENSIEISDSNCYGNHEIKIEIEDAAL